MNLVHTRIWVICLVLIVVTLSGCRNFDTSSVPVTVESPTEWQTYTNVNHKFSFQYPPGWKIKEFSAIGNERKQEEVWFAAGELPPENTDAQSELTLIITKDSPLARWKQEYFDEYQSEIIPIGDGRAMKISGVNKESLYRETVVILELDDVYLQLLPGQSAQALEAFEQILNTFNSVLPPTAEVQTVKKGICIAPYFDPIAILPGNDRILFRSDSGIMLLNLKTLEEEVVLESPLQVVKAAVSPIGKTLSWALEDHRIEIIELPSGKILNTLKGHTGFVTAIKFSKTGDRIFTASHDNSIKVWDVDGGLISEFYPGGGEVLGIGVSPDETKMGIVTFEGPQKLWDLQTNELIENIGSTGAFDGSDAGFLPNGQIVGIALGGGQTFLWDVEKGKQLWSGGYYALTLSQDGKYIAYSDVDLGGNNVVVLSSMTGQQLIEPLMGHTGMIWKIFFSPDSSMLISTGSEIRVWQTSDGELLHEFATTCS